MKKIFIATLILTAFTTQTTWCMQTGSTDNTPFAYTMQDALAKNPLFQKMKELCKPIEEKYEVIIEDLILLPKQQQKEFLDQINQDPKNLEASKLISSVIFNDSSTTDNSSSSASAD